MANGTLAPDARQQFFDNNGLPLGNGRLYTYTAGTDTPLPIYTDVALAVPHTNPAILDGAGRITIYLLPGSYKFVLKDQYDNTVWSQDHITTIPGISADLDYEGTAGENLPAQTPVYFAADGKWYLARGDDPSKSTAAKIVGMTLALIAIGQRGGIRVAGSMLLGSGLVPGATYYIGPTGGLTTTVIEGARRMGYADADGRTLIIAPSQLPPGADEGIVIPATAGTHDLFLPSLMFNPRSALNPCGPHRTTVNPANQGEVITLPFGPTAVQYAYTWVKLPKSWDQNAITLDVVWAQDAGGTGNVRWRFQVQRVAHDGDITGTSPFWGDAALTDNVHAQYKLTVSGAVSLGSSNSTGFFLHIIVLRWADQAEDTYPNDAQFIGATLRFKTIADTDD